MSFISYKRAFVESKPILLRKKLTVTEGDPLVACDFISEKTGLSKALVKKVMTNGGAWQITGKRKNRLRKAKKDLKAGDKIEFYYDSSMPEIDTSEINCLFETRSYGVWFKPANVLSQGTKFGDLGSIQRHVEKLRGNDVYLVNRLDKETAGLIVLAYNPKAQRAFATIWSKKVKKYYQAIVLGHLEGEGEIDLDIEGKKAVTKYKSSKVLKNTTKIELEIITGRKHQIRIHLNSIGHPVMGDPKYGEGNKNREGLKLIASKLEFSDPFDKSKKSFQSPKLLFEN
jgi:tRNA pseudouridine32 synthase / 23S rRNA pseudouridine746 synthase